MYRHRNMIKIPIILFLLCPWVSSAQSVVTGRVVVQNGSPVSGVNIYCPENNTGTSSDSLGFFELECDIPCTLEFSHVNYKKESYKIRSNDAPFIMTLRNKLNNLKEVVVTGRTIPGRLYSSRKGIEMIPAILGEQDILKYLATTPGIISANALDPGLYVRGGNSYENGFLTNDIEIASPDHLTGILSTFDPFVLNKSTIYKSGFPASYNSYLSSYINMRPDPGNKQKYEGEATLGLVSSALKAKGPILKDHTSFAASLRTSYLQTIAKVYNNAIKGTGDQNFMPEYSFNDMTLSLDSRLNDKWQLSAFGLFTIDKLSMKLSETSRYDFDWHTFSANAGATYTPNSKHIFYIQAGVKSAFSEGDADGSIPMGGGNRHYSAIGRVTWKYISGERIQLNAGARFEQARFETADKSDSQTDLLIRSSDHRFNMYELYAEANVHLNSYFSIQGGLNYQYYNGESQVNTFSPRAKISFTTKGFTFWADYSKTAQYLSLYPYFTVKTPIDIWYPLSQNMKPATCHQYSIGASQEFGNLLSLYAGVFYKKMFHLKDFSSGLSTKYTTLTEQMIEGKGYAKGMEFNLAFYLNALDIRFNYTLSESKRKFDEINDGREFYPPYDVKHNVVVNSSWDISRRFTLNALWMFSSGIYTTFPVGMALANNITDSQNRPIIIPIYTDRYNYKLPDTHRLDLNLDYTIPYRHVTLKLSVGAYNVYNQSNPSFIYFKSEEHHPEGQKIVPKSKVILPFIPYISLRLKI